jgi:hypothetical protein
MGKRTGRKQTKKPQARSEKTSPARTTTKPEIDDEEVPAAASSLRPSMTFLLKFLAILAPRSAPIAGLAFSILPIIGLIYPRLPHPEPEWTLHGLWLLFFVLMLAAGVSAFLDRSLSTVQPK